MARFFNFLRSNFTEEVQFGQQILNFTSQVRKRKGDLLISSENLSILELSKLITLAKFFDGFQITVVMVYRIFACRVLSLFNQVAKTTKNEDYTFSSALLYRYMDTHWVEDFDDLVTKFSKLFGIKNIKIIDYYGVQAANKNIAQVFLCEVFNISSACALKGLSNNLLNNDVRINSRVDLHKKQLTSVFQLYAAANNCSYRDHEHRYFIRNNIVWQNPPPPLASNFTFLKRYSLFSDKNIREKYAKNILYGNRTANEEAMGRELIYDEINPLSSSMPAAFMSEMKAVLKQVRQKRFCSGSSTKNSTSTKRFKAIADT